MKFDVEDVPACLVGTERTREICDPRRVENTSGDGRHLIGNLDSETSQWAFVPARLKPERREPLTHYGVGVHVRGVTGDFDHRLCCEIGEKPTIRLVGCDGAYFRRDVIRFPRGTNIDDGNIICMSQGNVEL